MGIAANIYQSSADELFPASGQSAADIESRPVDLVHLSKFTMGNRDLEREVLTLFRKQSVLFIDRMRHANDDQSWKEAAHTMKGSARGIGAWAVGDAAYEAEQLHGGDREIYGPAAVAKLDRAFAEACNFIENIMWE
jgi:HPt (histidine-containing phosphotransfer) domain-containing protein